MRHWIVPIGLLFLALLLSVLIPRQLSVNAEPFQLGTCPSGDSDYADDLKDGYRLERAGELEEALAKYRLASKAKSLVIRGVAERNRDRVNQKLEILSFYWGDLKALAKFLNKVRLPIALISALLVLLGAINLITPRKGIGIGPFGLSGTSDSSASAAFNHFLFDELAEIRQVHSSAQVRRIGALAISDILLLTGEGGEDVWTRALSSAREAELKSVVAFSLGELIRFLKGLTARPSYTISGRVCLVPGEACVVAELTDLRHGEVLMRCEATSTEIQQVYTGSAAAPFTTPVSLSSGTRRAQSQWIDDYRQNQKQMRDAATVLACKIWWKLAQGAQAEFRPQSWRTVFYLVQALVAMESH